ncbi:hypothetical protein SLS60_008346 [Paraconiothyrium brasiliense]|uniref:Transcription factor CBF/NF-Y/archaeal histone domain-containing protein n=1 Tax=Paraconiothyrium brasiliense TaxID=300254 RepID=A0ABR3R0B4_9PLEO
MAGLTYGANTIWQMALPNLYPADESGPQIPWDEAIHLPGSSQMQWVKKAILDRGNGTYFNRIPAQDIIVGNAGISDARIAATRDADGSWLMVYSPNATFTVETKSLNGCDIKASWFSPLTGEYTRVKNYTQCGGSTVHRFELPLAEVARVQKIINADPERLHTSKNAAFAIALATELFIQHFATATHNVVKAETQKKPRRNVQYRDVATAVAKTDNLEFLVDVVPKTVRFGEVREKRERKEKEAEGKGKEGSKENGEGASGNALERLMANGKKVNEAEKEKAEKESPMAEQTEGGAEAMEVDQEPQKAEEAKATPVVVEVEDSEPEQDEVAMQIEMEMRGPRTNGSAAAAAKAPTVSPSTQRPTRSSGFTAINGSK